MSKEELREKLRNPEFVVIDVRKKPDWDKSSLKIQAATHEDYERVTEWAGKYPRDKTFVLYCA
jgi:rhodanese-related sulfurtransferase